MTTFAGIVGFAAPPGIGEQALVDAVAVGRYGPSRVKSLGSAIFAQRVAQVDGVDRELLPSLRPGRILFAASARLDNRDELASALGIAPRVCAQMPDELLILRMIERWGEAGVARCLGAFCFALWNAETRRLVLGRDCLGNRAMFFYRGRDFVAFASTLKACLALPDVPRAIDEVTLANFMIVNLTEPRRTFYRGIERVPSRTLVTIDSAGVSHRQYWIPDLDAPPPYRRDEDYVERARELLDQAVVAATADTPHVAVSTSGGLDSSAIAATAARLGRAGRITCYSLVLPAGTRIDVGSQHYPDERDKVAALARRYPGLDVRFFAPETLHPFEDDDTRYFDSAGVPALSPVVLGTYGFLYDAVAAAGHRALLTGNYGNASLTWGGGFSLLALLRSGSAAAFARETRAVARQSGRGLARTFASDVLLPAMPASCRRSLSRLLGRNPDATVYSRALNPDFLEQLDLPRHWQANGFDPWFGKSGWQPARHRAGMLFDKNQFARDLKGMSDDLRGYEVRDPLGDRRLAEFMLKVPEPMFRRNGIPRSFARAVLADRLPPEILNERRRGAQAVTWFRRLDARRQDIAADLDRLESSPLARRMIDLPHLKRLMEKWPANEKAAASQKDAYALMLTRGLHIGRFIRWVESGAA